MTGGMRRILNLGTYDGLRQLYSIQRLDLLRMNFFHPTAEHGNAKVVPTLTPNRARICNTNLAAAVAAAAPNRRRICNTNLAAAPMMYPPISELVIRPPQLEYKQNQHTVHFLPTASESKVVLADRANRMLRFNVVDGIGCIDTLPTLHGYKVMPMAISVPPTDLQLNDGEDTGDLFIIDGDLYQHMAEERPQFEALEWRGTPPYCLSDTFWQCDALPLPPWITHHKRAYVRSHALVGGDTICFSISADAEGAGTYRFHIRTREWSKAGNWLMPFQGKADYVPELGLWFGISSQDDLPCAADLSGLVGGGEEPPPPEKMWARDDLPEECQPNPLVKPKLVSLGCGRFILVDVLYTMAFDKCSNEIVPVKEFALFTGMEVAFSNGSAGNERGQHNNNSGSSGGDENDGKGKGTMCGLRMMKHKCRRYMFNDQHRIEAVL